MTINLETPDEFFLIQVTKKSLETISFCLELIYKAVYLTHIGSYQSTARSWSRSLAQYKNDECPANLKVLCPSRERSTFFRRPQTRCWTSPEDRPGWPSCRRWTFDPPRWRRCCFSERPSRSLPWGQEYERTWAIGCYRTKPKRS